MTETPPPIIDYRPPDSNERLRFPFLKFIGGVIAGNVAVLMGWAIVGQMGGEAGAFIAVIAIEFVAGLFVLNASRQAKPFGIGMLCAVPIGITIFFIGCAILLSGANFH